MARVVAAGLVDDRQFAASRARRLLAAGRSPARIRASLAAKGLDGPAIAAALRDLTDELGRSRAGRSGGLCQTPAPRAMGTGGHAGRPQGQGSGGVGPGGVRLPGGAQGRRGRRHRGARARGRRRPGALSSDGDAAGIRLVIQRAAGSASRCCRKMRPRNRRAMAGKAASSRPVATRLGSGVLTRGHRRRLDQDQGLRRRAGSPASRRGCRRSRPSWQGYPPRGRRGARAARPPPGRRAAPHRSRPAPSGGSSDCSARPSCCMARIAMRCAARSSKRRAGCSRRTVSANGPPPGTTMRAGPDPPASAPQPAAQRRRVVQAAAELDDPHRRLPKSALTAERRQPHAASSRQASRRPAPWLMGVVNVTPELVHRRRPLLAPDAAAAHGRQLLADGAHLLDLGGESTAPGSRPITGDEELRAARARGARARADGDPVDRHLPRRDGGPLPGAGCRGSSTTSRPCAPIRRWRPWSAICGPCW